METNMADVYLPFSMEVQVHFIKTENGDYLLRGMSEENMREVARIFGVGAKNLGMKASVIVTNEGEIPRDVPINKDASPQA